MTISYIGNNIYLGLSSDTKPTNVPTGAIFITTDTRIFYVFNGSWSELSGAGGGGSGSASFILEIDGSICNCKSGLTGSVVSTSSTADCSVPLQYAITNVPEGGTILLKPGLYNLANSSSPGGGILKFYHGCTIIGYGATIKAVTGFPSYVIFDCVDFIPNLCTLNFLGITFDCNKIAFGAISTGLNLDGPVCWPSCATSNYPRWVLVRDCNILNSRSYGINSYGSGGVSGNADATLVIQNCYFNAGSYIGDANWDMLNEQIFTMGMRNVIIENTSIYGNKAIYVGGKNISIKDVEASTGGQGGGVVGHYGFQISAENVNLNRIKLIGYGINGITPYVASDSGLPYGNLEHCVVDNADIDTQGHGYSIKVGGLSSTCFARYISLRNIRFHGNAEIRVMEYAENEPAFGLDSSVHKLDIDGVHYDDVGSNGVIVRIQNINVHEIRLANVSSNLSNFWTWTALTAPILVEANLSNVFIGTVRYEDVEPHQAAGPAYIFRGKKPPGGSFQIFGPTFMAPPRAGLNAVSLENGVSSNWNFISNNGTSTQSGNGSATQFLIPHRLRGTPIKYYVTPASAAARISPFSVTADGTNLIIDYTTAPVTGTNNVVFRWEAECT